MSNQMSGTNYVQALVTQKPVYDNAVKKRRKKKRPAKEK
jgi:hypothetical protein